MHLRQKDWFSKLNAFPPYSYVSMGTVIEYLPSGVRLLE